VTTTRSGTERQRSAEITGLLLYVDPKASACNVQVGVVEIHHIPESAASSIAFAQANPGTILLSGYRCAKLRLEYGQADHFLKI
jgi:hypothetical protein